MIPIGLIMGFIKSFFGLKRIAQEHRLFNISEDDLNLLRTEKEF